jgi:electron transport complex protein RnfD
VVSADATTTATPLGVTKEGTKFNVKASESFDYNNAVRWKLFLGDVNGSIGETSALAILIGFAWLLLRKVVSWHIPVSYMGAMAVFTLLMNPVFPELAMPVDFHLLAGGALFGAVFMATDMVTSPVTVWGQVVFGAGCGILTMIIRVVPGGSYPEGVTFAILIMDALTPLINRATRYNRFGVGRRVLAKKVAG